MKDSLTKRAYDSIKQDILSGVFLPNTMLSENKLCEQLKISRTPIREALSKLINEGFVRVISKKGIWVAPIRLSDMIELFEARCFVEPYIIKNLKKEDISSDFIESLEKVVSDYGQKTECDFEGTFALDSAFHNIIASRCKNKYILQTYKSLRDREDQRLVIFGKNNIKRAKETFLEHGAVLEQIKKGNFIKAAENMQKHINLALKDTLDKIKNMGNIDLD